LEVGGGAEEEVRKEGVKGLTEAEVREAAEVCVALLEAQGKRIEETLCELRSGGWLAAEEVGRVAELARELARLWGQSEMLP
jgi:hypothetical protein